MNQSGGYLPRDARVRIIARLRAERPEIVADILKRIRAMSKIPEDDEPEYRAGLLAAVAANFDYGLSGMESADTSTVPIPGAAIDQARRAARNGVDLDAVLRRYIVGDRVFGEHVLAVTEEVAKSATRVILRLQTVQLARLLEVISAEYAAELDRVGADTMHLTGTVHGLLQNHPVDLADVPYDFGGWHLGLIAQGEEAEEVVSSLAQRLPAELLMVPGGGAKLWAWLGGRTPIAIADVERALVATGGSERVTIAAGDPRASMEGWRQTHQEAQAAHLVARRGPKRFVRCADVSVEAALLQSPELANLLLDTYLVPLSRLRDGGKAARKTVRAYIACSQNISSTASHLKVARRTVENRLNQVEETLGHPLSSYLTRLELALRLEDLGYPPDESGVDPVS